MNTIDLKYSFGIIYHYSPLNYPWFSKLVNKPISCQNFVFCLFRALLSLRTIASSVKHCSYCETLFWRVKMLHIGYNRCISLFPFSHSKKKLEKVFSQILELIVDFGSLYTWKLWKTRKECLLN